MIVPLNDTVYSVARQGIVPEYTLDFGPGQKQLQREYTDYVAQNWPDAMTGPKRAEEMGLAQLGALFFTERNDLFSYRRGGDPYIAIRNNQSGHIKSLRIQGTSSLMSDMDHITLMIPYGADSERMYMMVNPYALAELPAEKQNERTRALKAEYSQDDNPVIAVVRMKDF